MTVLWFYGEIQCLEYNSFKWYRGAEHLDAEHVQTPGPGFEGPCADRTKPTPVTARALPTETKVSI